MERKKEIALDSILIGYYLIEAMLASILLTDIGKEGQFLPSHALLFHELEKEKEAIKDKLAQYLYDYLIVQILLEMQNCRTLCSHVYDIPENTYDYPENFAPTNVLKGAIDLFNCEWEDGYGGHLWKKAAQIGLFYKKVPNETFIDLVVDLQHNTGSLLNKVDYLSAFIYTNSLMFYFRDFCDSKTYTLDSSLFVAKYWNLTPKKVQKICLRFLTLYAPQKLNICTRNTLSEYVTHNYFSYPSSRCPEKELEEIISNSWSGIKSYAPMEFADEPGYWFDPNYLIPNVIWDFLDK